VYCIVGCTFLRGNSLVAWVVVVCSCWGLKENSLEMNDVFAFSSSCVAPTFSSLLSYFVEYEDTNSSAAIAARVSELVDALRAALSTHDGKQTLEALEDLLKFSRIKEQQEMLASPKTGLVGVLLSILRSYSKKASSPRPKLASVSKDASANSEDQALSMCCALFWNLCAHHNNKILLASMDCGLVSLLVGILRILATPEHASSSTAVDIRNKACGALRNLATHPDNRHIMVASDINLVPVLLQIITGTNS
jgi:signal transduction histidine kinase